MTSSGSPFRLAIDLLTRLGRFLPHFAGHCHLINCSRRKRPLQCPLQTQTIRKYKTQTEVVAYCHTYHVDYRRTATILRCSSAPLGLLELFLLRCRVEVFRSTDFDVHLVCPHQVGAVEDFVCVLDEGWEKGLDTPQNIRLVLL